MFENKAQKQLAQFVKISADEKTIRLETSKQLASKLGFNKRDIETAWEHRWELNDGNAVIKAGKILFPGETKEVTLLTIGLTSGFSMFGEPDIEVHHTDEMFDELCEDVMAQLG